MDGLHGVNGGTEVGAVEIGSAVQRVHQGQPEAEKLLLARKQRCSSAGWLLTPAPTA